MTETGIVSAPEPIRIFIGYDPAREPVCYHVCCESIIRNTSLPVQITPLALNTVRVYYGETHADGSNSFTYSRFLIPWLCGWRGWAIFLDGDMIVRGDIAELWRERDHHGVKVVKHDYQTKYPTKYLGARNEDYPRKNWSSVILWNCNYYPHRCLTPNFVANAAGAYLHHFEWLKNEAIGALDPTWNHLTLEYEHKPDARLVHYTIGAPCFKEYATQEHAGEWFATLRGALAPMELPI